MCFVYCLGKNTVCDRNNGGCDHICVDNEHGRDCYCRSGFKLYNRTKCIGTFKNIKRSSSVNLKYNL